MLSMHPQCKIKQREKAHLYSQTKLQINAPGKQLYAPNKYFL